MASDEEIKEFFEETIFEGVFSKDIKSKNTEFYKGNISNIKLEGRKTDLVGGFLNVPKTSNQIPEGACSFKCRINIPALREDANAYRINLIGGSLQSIENFTTPVIAVSARDAKERELFDMWGVDNCECIGFYHYDEINDIYVVDDLRKPNFDHIPYYPGDVKKSPIRITYPHQIRGIKLDNYYLFTWKLSHKNDFNPYEIYIDFVTQPRSIDPKWFIDTLFNDRHNDKSKNFGSATNFLDTLSKQLSAKESTFVYELLQNANDYPVEGQMVDVEFHITDNYLLFLHSGDKFNVRNISGICGINEKEKVANKRTIGYKGIGFKTVFLHNHYVYLQTGDYSFRFDEGETPEKKVGGKIKRLGAPFQILPIWTEHNEVSPEVTQVFDESDKKFRVRLALRPEDKNILHVGKNSYENLFRDIFADSNIILFIPNINSVRVFISGKEERVCFRNSEEWVVGDYEKDIAPELQEAINKTIEKGNSRIPEKYKDFDCTKVSFACKHEGAMIKTVDKATLYCYLPTKASWGFPFLMNTDMIPKGDRNDIETEVKLANADESNFNEELAAIAGDKFFCWIRDLLTSRKYQLGSVFSLIPDFKKCKKEHDFYDEFIEQFEKTFNENVETGTIVPVKQGIANVKNVIFDTTGLSTSGIMTDEEFCTFTELGNYYLPLPVLRKEKCFNAFLKRYVEEEQKFTEEDLPKLISNEDFKEWLKNQENNNKFLNFLLENEYIKNLLDEEIFLDADGELYAASDLFYDIDEYLSDLEAFTDHLLYLSPKTREFFSENAKWEEAINDAFAEFDADKFVNDVLLSEYSSETKERLEDKNTSINFYKFLAENVAFCEDFLDLPFISDREDVVEDFNDKFVFFTSVKGHDVFAKEWMANVAVAFLSSDYTDEAKLYLKENFDVKNYSDDIVIKDIILTEDYHDGIEDEITNDYNVSKSFVDFCYAQKDSFDNGVLRKYSLYAFDCNGDSASCLTECNIYFESNLYNYYAAKEWIDCDWMYVLDKDYFDGIADTNDFQKFLRKAFWVEELSEKSFYKDVVRANIKDIFSNTSGDSDSDGSKNIDFVRYLDDNYKLIFEEEKDYDKFSEFKPVSNDGGDLSLSDSVYIFDGELAEIIERSWFPQDVVYLCSKEYGASASLGAIGCKKFKFGDFYDEVIVENISSINKAITSKEESVDFHNFIISKLDCLTTAQQANMSEAIVYLCGKDDAVEGAGGHNTLSANAKELFDLGLVDFADLDIIDPDYTPEQNTEYWETRLGNSKFTVSTFFSWMKDNLDSFCDTLQSEDLNIAFWRWLKGNYSDKYVEELCKLPVVLKNGEIDTDRPIYFSDEYMNGAGIENSIKRYDEKAKFLSPNYVAEGDKIEDWKSLFSNIGIKYEIIDILVDTIIPQLSDITDENLPKLIAEYREALEKKYEDGLIPNLVDLQVKAHDGKFYDIHKAIYVDCEKEEPFAYIELPNQISFGSADERRLIKDILDEIDSKSINSLSEWQQYKLDRYLELQEKDIENIRPFHYQFIEDLAVIRNNSHDSLKDLEHIEGILLLNKDGEFCCATELTMSSVYNPFFDFEACGISSLEYVSDDYSTKCTEYVGKVFRELKMHCEFQECDIKFLEKRECAIYFWSKYLTKKEYTDTRIPKIKKFIADGKFSNVACIPTKDYMKCAFGLYYGNEVSRYLKNIEDAENKTPLLSLPDVQLDNDETLFGNLPFKKSLDFLDALYALVSVTGQDKRTLLLQWMIDGYDEAYDEKIEEYREDKNALWKNNKNEDVQIKNLYALAYGDKTLEQFFGQNPRIVNKNYLPTGDSFKTICDILRIDTITSGDLAMEPVGDTIYTSCDVNHRLYALVIAGMMDSDNWQEIYKKYCERLDVLTLHRCESIMITYSKNAEINQSLKKFYHQPDSNDFYFVNQLDGKRVFQSFVDAFVDFLGINLNDIAKDVVVDIMDCPKNALDIAKEQNNLMLDEKYKDELDKLIPGIRRELSGKEAIDDDKEDVDRRPSFSTYEEESKSSSVDEIEDKEDVGEAEDDLPDDSEMPILYETNEEVESGKEPTLTPKRPCSPAPKTKSHHSTGRYDNGETPIPQYRKRTDYPDMRGWEGGSSSYTPQKPKPYSPEDVRNFGSNGIPMELAVLEPTKAEINEVNTLLGENMTAEQIADQNYLAQLRLYYNLVEKGYNPDESKADFVRNAHLKNEHTLSGGKYIHKCSAAGGIMYLSPSIWNKIEDDRCVVCVYLGAKANEFKYFNSIDDILECIGKDDIIIKLTGEEKVRVVRTLYSGVLEGVKGTAYTLIRIKSNEKYNSVFAPLQRGDMNSEEEKEEDY